MANSARNRLFTSPPSVPGIASAYGWSADAVITGAGVNPVTGAWSPVSVDANGVVDVAIAGGISISGASISVSAVAITGNPLMTVSNTAPMPISGVVQATLSVAPVVDAIVSGNSSLIVANQLNSGISGLLAGNLSDIAGVSGAVSVTGWNTGNIVTVRNLSSPTVTNYGPSGVAPFTAMGSVWGQALAANSDRLEMFIQNIHTGVPLYVNLGATAASTGNFSMILNPSTVANWGGSSFGSSRYKGAVQASGGAWVAWEI